MKRYERILIATDLSEQANKALAEAISIARRHDAELHVLHVDMIRQADIGGFEQPALAGYIHSLGQTAMSAAGRDVGVGYAKTVTAVVRDTSESAGILRYAAEHAIDLIVVGTHGRGPASELFLGSVAQRVVRESPISVVVVGARRSARPPPAGKPVILAPTDLSVRSGRALAHAAALAAERGGHLIALHVIDPERIGLAVPPGSGEDAAREQLEDFVSTLGMAVEPELLIGGGRAGDVILDLAAKRDAGLIVMAPSRHSALDRLLMGSVTKRVVRAAPCPVLVHHTPARQVLPGVAA